MELQVSAIEMRLHNKRSLVPRRSYIYLVFGVQTSLQHSITNYYTTARPPPQALSALFNPGAQCPSAI